MASHEGSRKRLKMSRNEAGAGGPHTAAIATTSTLGQLTTPASSCQTGPCEHEHGLKTLNTDVDAMRQLVTCKVCDRLLYEPYALACGHTYCYQCLRQWFENNKSKKTCPDCRMKVTQLPTPSYVLRELVLIFVSRNELLPDGETTDEHKKWSKEEADLVAADRASTDAKTGGLFKGMFNGRRSWGPMRDAADGVDRCPECHWELEDGECGQCGLRVDEEGFSDFEDDSDLTDDELDNEIDEQDAAAFFGADGADDYMGPPIYLSDSDNASGRGPSVMHSDSDRDIREAMDLINRADASERRRERRARITVDLRSTDDEDEESDNEEGHREMDGFIANDDEDQDPASSGSESSEDTNIPATTRRRGMGVRRGIPVVISDEEGETAASAGAPVTDDDSEDEGPIMRGSQRNKRSGRVTLRGVPLPRRVIDASSPENSDAEDDESRTGHRENAAPFGGFSPLQGGDSGSESRDSDEESEAVSSVHPMYASDDEVELDADDFDEHGVDEDDEDDGWGTETQTPRHPRPSATSESHRLHTRGQHSNRHSSGFGGRLGQTRTSPSGRRFAERNVAQPHHTRLPSHSEGSRRDDPSRLSAYAARLSRNTGSAFRAPSHPFQLDNTLASVNSAYNQRAHGHRGEEDLHRNPESSGSSGSSRTVGRGMDGRRKRALSIDSDVLDGAYDAAAYFDSE